MKIYIELLKVDGLVNLYNFELKNREYFEKFVPTRGDEYYDYNIFVDRNVELIKEMDLNKSLFYLIKSEYDGNIIGRINLVDIDNEYKTASLGYRIGEDFIGKGVASKALSILIDSIDNKLVNQIIAKTTTNNIGSQKVMEKNNFILKSIDEEEFEMNGEKLKFVNYILNL